jgi:hypothetical protein
MNGKRISVAFVFALVALALALSARGGAEAQSYNPSNTYTLSSHTPGDATGYLETVFSIAAPDYNYEDASMTILLPPDEWIANGGEADIGAKVGTLDYNVMVGLLGGQCNFLYPAHFDLYNASVNIDVPEPWIPIIDYIWDPPGPLPDTDGDTIPDYVEMYPQFLNTLLDPPGTTSLPLQPRARLASVTFASNRLMLVHVLLFDPKEMARLGGVYTQMGDEKGTATLIVINNPLGEEPTPGVISDFCTPSSITTHLLGTTVDNPATEPDEGNDIRQKNPPANSGILLSGTHMLYTYSQSERNADGDAFENDFDACPYTADPANWNPRVVNCVPGSQPGDQDCDMLPVSCDPHDSVADPDIDLDNYSNTQDNCPFVPNGCKNAVCGPIWVLTWDNQADRDRALANEDWGPRSDAIGDACDDSDDDGDEDGAGGLADPGSCNDGFDNDGSEDGGAAGTCNDGIDNGGGDGADNNDTDCWQGADGRDADCAPFMDKADWSPTTANPQQGTYYHAMPWDAECVGATDTDNDGYCDITEVSLGSRPNGGTPENLVIDAEMTAEEALPSATAAQSCSDGVDNDGDGTTDGGDLECQEDAVTGDIDNDGFSDNAASVGFSAQITGDHSGFETVTSESGYTAFSWSYADGAIKIGNGADFQCWIVRPADVDWLGPGAGDPNDLEAQVHCKGQPVKYDWKHVDLDGDGDQDIYWHKVWDDPRDPTGDDNCPSIWNPTQTNTDLGKGAWASGGMPAGDALGDACDADDDADGYSDIIENYLPTDPLDRCTNGMAGPVATRSDAWALDITLDTVVTAADVIRFAGKIGCKPSGSSCGGLSTPPASWSLSRLDFNKDGTITAADVLKFAGRIGQDCDNAP